MADSGGEPGAAFLLGSESSDGVGLPGARAHQPLSILVGIVVQEQTLQFASSC